MIQINTKQLNLFFASDIVTDDLKNLIKNLIIKDLENDIPISSNIKLYNLLNDLKLLKTVKNKNNIIKS